MNINEVEKHVKSEFIVTIILYILTGLTMIISIFVILITPAKALTDDNISDAIYTGTQHTVTSQPGMAMADVSVTNDVYSTITQNTWTSDVYSIYFQVNTGISASSNVTIRINTSSTLKNLRYTCNSTHVSCRVRYISNNQLNINFSTGSSPVTYAGFFISTEDNSSISGIDLFRWTSVHLLTNPISSGGSGGSGSSFDDTGIINNANQNTNSIIENNNSNTQEIINNNNSNTDSINDNISFNVWKLITQFEKSCLNIINPVSFNTCSTNDSTGSLVNCNTNISSSSIQDGSITFSNVNSWRGISYDLLPVEPGLTYYLKFNLSLSNTNRMQVKYVYYDKEKSYLHSIGSYVDTSTVSKSFLIPANTYYMRIVFVNPIANSSITISNLVLSGGNITFCPYGSSAGNRLDGIEGAIQGGLFDVNNSVQDVKDIQQDTYDYMTDDTNPTINTSDINNVIGQVQIQDPLNYLLTLPLNLLTKLNTVISAGSCSKASFGVLYGTELYLPCINFENYLGSSLWTTIDTIVGIGLLVVILKKFYDTISNILSLGKEEEIRKGMELPTPMEFLAQILGGGK